MGDVTEGWQLDLQVQAPASVGLQQLPADMDDLINLNRAILDLCLPGYHGLIGTFDVVAFHHLISACRSFFAGLVGWCHLQYTRCYL